MILEQQFAAMSLEKFAAFSVWACHDVMMELRRCDRRELEIKGIGLLLPIRVITCQSSHIIEKDSTGVRECTGSFARRLLMQPAFPFEDVRRASSAGDKLSPASSRTSLTKCCEPPAAAPPPARSVARSWPCAALHRSVSERMQGMITSGSIHNQSAWVPAQAQTMPLGRGASGGLQAPGHCGSRLLFLSRALSQSSGTLALL